jgi:peptide/nickel transport system ATP-binding protein
MLTNFASPILEIRGLQLSISTDEGLARVLDHIDLEIPRGKIVGVVGESGCGKSTLIRAILGVLPRAARIESGSIRFEGRNLIGPERETVLREIRGRAIGFIPQDPLLAFNPVFKIGTQLLELFRSYDPLNGKGELHLGRSNSAHYRQRLLELIRLVQVPDPEAMLDRYPHQISGGQRQRLLIASSLLLNPALVIADEPTTSLDVTTQREILRLLKDLATRLHISMLFITHDFGVVAQLCDVVSVMYAGQTVETGLTRDLLSAPQHPYTQALLGCHPDRSRELTSIAGTVPSPLSPPPGCRYQTRCPKVTDPCRTSRPVPVAVSNSSTVACTLFDPAIPRLGNELIAHGAV